MKSFMILAFTLLLSACTSAEYIPLNTIERANEMCSTLDGVKNLKVSTQCAMVGKFCTDDMITEVSVVCSRYDTHITTEIKWKPQQ